MNDLIELHQNEIENLKQGIADMEEKIQYQSEERLRDVYEMLESCQTRVRPPDPHKSILSVPPVFRRHNFLCSPRTTVHPFVARDAT